MAICYVDDTSVRRHARSVMHWLLANAYVFLVLQLKDFESGRHFLMKNCPKRIYFNTVTNCVKVKVMSGHVQGHLKVTCTLQVVRRIVLSVCNFISHSVKSNVFFGFLLFHQYQPTKVEDNSCC